MSATTLLLQEVQQADEDFEWYPTTARMISIVAQHIPADAKSIMDIGAGDGRVLAALSIDMRRREANAEPYYTRSSYSGPFTPAETAEAIEVAFNRAKGPTLYAIEKAMTLIAAQPDGVIPVGTDLFEQNLACLPVDFIFCNPPYSEFETWARMIIESAFAERAYLVIPRRWSQSATIAESLAKRNARTRVIHSDDFLDGERRARAVIDIVEVTFPKTGSYERKPADPFDVWFDQNVGTFDQEKIEAEAEAVAAHGLAKIRGLDSITAMVEAFNEEYARMESNYREIFKLDYALLKELGVEKAAVRDGIKAKMAGLKSKYWGVLFERLDVITKRLSTATKKGFLERLTGRTAVAFTGSNAYAVVTWAIKNANKYFDQQCVELFRALSTFDGVQNYKSNQRTWQNDGWRYRSEQFSHYALDYRIVLNHHAAIVGNSYARYGSFGNLDASAHEKIDDILAVLYNLGFEVKFAEKDANGAIIPDSGDTISRNREWSANKWQQFKLPDDSVLFEVKGFGNGNLHFRFKPDAIKALNVEAARLLGWIRSADEVVAELGYTPAEAARYFNSSRQILPSGIKLLSA